MSVAEMPRVISVGGLTSIPAKAFVLAELAKGNGQKVRRNNRFEQPRWMRGNAILNFGAKRRSPCFRLLKQMYIQAFRRTPKRRNAAHWHFGSWRKVRPISVVTTARSLAARTVSPDDIRRLGAVLKRDEDFPLDELVSRLVRAGYVREDPVNGVGQFSVRGGIVDIWPPDAENPLRVEFFGDTVDSIREFDAETQLSTGQLKEMSAAPMREFAASESDLKDWAFFARERWPGENLARNLKDRTDFAAEGETFSGWEFLIPLVKPLTSSVFDHVRRRRIRHRRALDHRRRDRQALRRSRQAI